MIITQEPAQSVAALDAPLSIEVTVPPAYYYSGWAALGVPPPQPGFQWVRYGPDLLLVNATTGQAVDSVYGAFY
jgi:Nickel/cobalt transporter regulator